MSSATKVNSSYVELLAKYHQQVLEKIDVFCLGKTYFMQVIPRKKKERIKAFDFKLPRSVNSNSTGKILFC